MNMQIVKRRDIIKEHFDRPLALLSVTSLLTDEEVPGKIPNSAIGYLSVECYFTVDTD